MLWQAECPPTDGNAIIHVRGLVKTYESLAGTVTALHGVDLTIHAGQFIVVVGKSGAGKTTLINLLSGLDRCTAGEIWVDGVAVHRMGPEAAARWRAQHVGVVFQSFELIPNLSLLHNVMLPAEFAGNGGGHSRRKRAQALLDEMEIGAHAGKPPSAISGGQQRVAIARALMNERDLA